MRSFTTRLSLVAGFIAAICLFAPLTQVQAAAGDIQVTIRDEARSPIANATVEVTCDASTYATLGTTSATGTIVGDPTVGTTCTNGSAPLFRVSSSTFATQFYPIIGYSLLPYYSSVDPSSSSTAISGSTNVYKFGLDTTSTYAMKVWNAHGNASVLPFPTRIPDYTFSSSTLAFNFGMDTSPYPGIDAQDFFIEATKTVTFGAGWYEFEVASDDGTLVTLDGVTVIDDYFLQPVPARPYTKRLLVSAGVHTVDVKYYEHTGYTGLYFRFYPIDPPAAPLVEIGAPVSSSVNNRLSPSFGIHSDTAGTLSVSGGCTTTDPVNIGVGTSTISLTVMPNGTYSSCHLTLLDPDTGYSTSLDIPSFTVISPPLVHIGSCTDLENIHSSSTNYAVDYILDSDIDCFGVSTSPQSWSEPFMGVFDGNNHTISRFTMSAPFMQSGLFREINGATFKNLTFTNSSIRAPYFKGLLAATAANPTVTNLRVQNTPVIVSFPFAEDHSGSLFGDLSFSNGTTTEWSNVITDGQVTSIFGDAGGLAGTLTLSSSSTLNLENIHTSSSILDVFASYLQSGGGFFGTANLTSGGALNITHSSSYTYVNVGTGASGGGFIGKVNVNASRPTALSISYSSSSRNLLGDNELGGLLGTVNVTDGSYPYTINLHHNLVTTDIAGGNNVGGLIAYLNSTFNSAVTSTITIDSNTSTGTITGYSNVGGLLGGSAGSGGGMYIQHAGGAGGLIISNNNVTGNITGNSDSATDFDAGGLIGFLSCKSNNSSQFAACTIRQNRVSGNVSGYSHVGGLAGKLEGDIDVEDSYSTGNVTGANNVGGFIGTLNSPFNYTNLSRAYSSSTVTTIGSTPTNIGGFIGQAQSSNANTNIDHAFAIASLSDPSGHARMGWMVGDLQNITPSALAYSPISGAGTACIQNNERASFCTSQADPSYFYSASNAPQSNWDFSGVWQEHDAAYPTLRLASITSDRTAPSISSVVATPSQGDALITWTTNEPASTNVIYGRGTFTNLQLGTGDQAPRVLTHRALLPALTICQAYQFQVVSTDAYGNTATSGPMAFTTLGCGGRAEGSGSSGGGSGGGSAWGSPLPVQTLVQPSSTGSTPTVNAPVSNNSVQEVTSNPAQGGSARSSETRQCFRYTFNKDLKSGANSADVQQLQLFLGLGTASSTTTFFGPTTKRALTDFQRRHQLPPNGQFTGATRTLIQSLMPTVSCPTTSTFTRTLTLNMTGTDVQALQHLLNITETSFFGPVTKKALQTFQQTHHLTTNGTTDAPTRAILNSLVK